MTTNGTGTALVGIKDTPQDVSFGDLLALSKELVPTGFLPDHIKTAGQCAAIILTGRELGMGPMRAIRSLQMVKGKVVENADSQLARFKADGGRATWKQLTETKAVLWLKHPNGDEHTEEFSFETAKAAGLTSNPVWRNYPKAMLRSRAITAGLKSVGWEGGVGNYDPQEAAEFAPSVTVPPVSGEVEDAEPVPAGAPSPKPTAKQRAFFDNLMKSSVWTDEERAVAQRAFDKADKAKASDMIDRAQEETERRKSEAEAALDEVEPEPDMLGVGQ